MNQSNASSNYLWTTTIGTHTEHIPSMKAAQEHVQQLNRESNDPIIDKFSLAFRGHISDIIHKESIELDDLTQCIITSMCI